LPAAAAQMGRLHLPASGQVSREDLLKRLHAKMEVSVRGVVGCPFVCCSSATHNPVQKGGEVGAGCCRRNRGCIC
jgi:hypothetical protein